MNERLFVGSTGATSAGGWPGMVRAGATIIASAFLVSPSASTSATLQQGHVRPPRVEPQTNAGFILQQQQRKRAAQNLSQLRRAAGFTWDQLARLFGVSRRAVHFWASGQPMAAENEERLHRLLAFVAEVDRGAPAETRAALLTVGAGGVRPFDLLGESRYEEAVAMLGGGATLKPARPTRLVRAPASWRPDELVEARTELAHTPEPVRPSTRGRARRERG